MVNDKMSVMQQFKYLTSQLKNCEEKELLQKREELKSYILSVLDQESTLWRQYILVLESVFESSFETERGTYDC